MPLAGVNRIALVTSLATFASTSFAGLPSSRSAQAAQAQAPAFEVASIKYRGDEPLLIPPTRTSPNVFYRSGETVETLIRLAYGLQRPQVIGGPDWIRKSFFEIQAKAAVGTPAEQIPLMLQSLLEDRFKLVVRKEQREMRAYTLGVARDDGRVGPGLTRCDPIAAPTVRRLPAGSMPFNGRCVPAASIARAAAGPMNATVVDKTGLAGLWTYWIDYARPTPLPPGRLRDLAEQENLLPFDAALRQELGLKLEAFDGPVDVLVIESVERPADN